MLENMIETLLKTVQGTVLETYLTEVAAAAAILILIFVYIIIKKPQPKQKVAADKPTTEIDKKEEEVKEPKVEAEEVIEEPEQVVADEKTQDSSESDLSGAEEGSFGDEVKVVEEEVPTESKKREKRTVPPHGKITKDDFRDFAGIKILVAEDNLINQKVISGLLSDSGIEIMMADDGQIVLDILETDSDFNFILMDAHMPRVDGFEATRQIRKNPAYEHILVVALSGDTAADDIRKMTEAGMEEQLEKPLRMDALYDVLYAYTKDESTDEDQEQNPDDYVKVMQTKEIDTDKGLSVCGDDEGFYNEILDEFITTYSDSAVKLREFLLASKVKEADRYLLDLSGITANIGATNMNRIVLSLKEALTHPQDKVYVELFKEYAISLQHLLEDIKKYKS